MAANISIRSSDDSTEITTLSWGTSDKGSTSSEVTIRVWNNYGGASAIDDATNCAITIKTYLELDTGDTVAHGQEVVTDTMIEAKCTSRGDTSFTAIGGATTLAIGNGVGSTTLSGDIADPTAQVSTVVLRLVVPSDATSASITAKIRILYS